ncbi:hypothetical protein HPB51_011121 [Rhipicephalus microplus]|uniref:Proteasome activator complex subunit 4 C-terminal domain-containing protein n=1 Tax=Rhipicephalus microplus TaxID=6941 RepID=A0A9J6E0A1_RHIMP|nr:hypothetical protein HPB51_011121 [Rhipicephalus microplus]
MQSDQTDEELQKDCAVALALLGNALLPPESIRAALATIREVVKSPHWHSRAASCNLLQFLVFTNLFTMQSCAEWRDAVIEHTLALLKDERLEVRETASETLGGLLHCEFLKVTDDLLATIKKTLSNFRRTHHDNWRDHKVKFTDDQLAVITDLLVSPSYYA